MNEWAEAKTVAMLSGGGSINHGEQIAFVFNLQDGGQERFKCEYTQLHKIVDGLRSFGQMANNDRAGRPAGTDLGEIIHPYVVQNFRTGRGIDEIGIQFSTQEGIPVTMTLPLPLAEKLIEHLALELGRKPPKFRRQ
jgi:hypothetical protein